MKIIKLNESELRNIIEMEVLQYSDNENIVKNFYTQLSDSDINIDEWTSIPDSYDVGGNLNIDWTCNINFNEKGFIYKIKINSVEGNIWYESDWRNNNSKKIFNISSKKGWNIEYNDLSTYDGKVIIDSIWVLPDRKIFKIT